MEFVASVIAWLADPAHWQGRDGIPIRLLEHVELSAASLLAGAAIALPFGFLVGHSGRGAFLVLSVANVGRALPSLAILGLALPFTIQLFHVLEFWPAFVALTVLAIPPILTNTWAGIRAVERDLVETSRGMGMSATQVLWRVEIPVARPVILGGLRTAAVQVVATATLGAYVAGGGFGRYVIDGIARNQLDRIFAGALLVAALSIATELAFAFLQRRLVSRGLRAATERTVPRTAT